MNIGNLTLDNTVGLRLFYLKSALQLSSKVAKLSSSK